MLLNEDRGTTDGGQPLSSSSTPRRLTATTLAGIRSHQVSVGAGRITIANTIMIATAMGEPAIETVVGPEGALSLSNLRNIQECRSFPMTGSPEAIDPLDQAHPIVRSRMQSTKAHERVCRRSNQVRLRPPHRSAIEHRVASLCRPAKSSNGQSLLGIRISALQQRPRCRANAE